MRIALCQMKSMVGNINRNKNKIISTIEKFKDSASLIVFPELSLTGYGCMDRFKDDSFIRQAFAAAEEITSFAIENKVGVIFGAPIRTSRGLVNAAVCVDGEYTMVAEKRLLPHYDIFYESRYFVPGTYSASNPNFNVIEIDGVRIGVQVCEDMWDNDYEEYPSLDLVKNNADIIINISSSPFHSGKNEERISAASRIVDMTNRPIIYLNAVGSQDGYDGEILFDGGSFALSSSKDVAYKYPYFNEHVDIIETNDLSRSFQDLSAHERLITINEENFVEDFPVNRLIKALSFGIREYRDRFKFNQMIIGLSGGIDSAVVAALAALSCDSDKRHEIIGIAMPSKFSSDESLRDAKQLAENLGISFIEAPIHEMYEKCLVDMKLGSNIFDIACENLQARLRGATLMAHSNRTNGLVLSTGNKTEIGLGYCTLYGDTVGGLSVIGDVDKEHVYMIARSINSIFSDVIPKNIIDRPPSAELSDDQTDEAAFGAGYDVLSPLVNMLIDGEYSEALRLFPTELVKKCKKLVDSSEYKRRQMAPALKVSSRSFGIGRRRAII